ncbi:MAG: 1-aminocyclopropane-1-carboxylate deaminase/D-cysteine desulfhydrase [Chitinophagales bacterium]|nr:1-aminocyclopropane-1-carboxylate deaminase/D-cysteine desulfhydrase [Chitinophagales bacterium]
MIRPQTPSPVYLLNEPLFDEKGVQVYLKRDDQIHPYVQGNKWRKLKYNLLEARLQQQNTILTFGGPYSNHIYATAAAARMFHFRSIGIIRGEEPTIKSPTLKFAASQGMELYYMDRVTYRHINEPYSIESLRVQLGDFYYVPEGGTNQYAIEGASEIVSEIDFAFDYITSPVGTSGTLAGIVAGLNGRNFAIGFSSLKGEDTLTTKVNALLLEYTGRSFTNFSINFNYHFDGYAKISSGLVEFIHQFRAKHNIMLEPVYTGKMMYGLYDLIQTDYFKRGDVIVAVHTGGLQGLCGFENHFPGWSSSSFS